MQVVKLSECTIVSKRHNSNTYLSADEKILYKFPSEEKQASESVYLNEMRLADLLHKVGISTPQVLGMVKAEETGWLGLAFVHIAGKESVSRCISRDPGNMEKYVKYYADMAKLIHTSSCDNGYLLSTKDSILVSLDLSPYYSDAEKQAVKRFLDTVDDGNAILHGDYNMTNLILADGKSYLIDIGLLTAGNPLFDLGISYIFGNYDPANTCESFFHMPMDTVRAAWRIFVKMYFETDSEAEVDRINEMLKPYGVAGFFIHALDYPNNQFVKMIKDKYFEEAFAQYMQK